MLWESSLVWLEVREGVEDRIRRVDSVEGFEYGVVGFVACGWWEL